MPAQPPQGPQRQQDRAVQPEFDANDAGHIAAKPENVDCASDTAPTWPKMNWKPSTMIA